jgi:hypothetical protein
MTATRFQLDPKPDPLDSPDTVPDQVPDTIATPQGDNEYGPDQPLPAGTEPAITRPPGSEPHPRQPIRKALE